MIGGEITAFSDNTEPVPSFLDFAETDLAFGEPIPIARPVIRFFVVCPNGRAALEHLVRKCNGDGSSGVQEFYQSDDYARELKQTLAQIVRFVRKAPIIAHDRCTARAPIRRLGSSWKLVVGSWELTGLFPQELRAARIVFEADKVHQLRAGLEIFVERDGERMRVGLRIGGRPVNGKGVKAEV